MALLLSWWTEPWRSCTSTVWAAAGRSQQCPLLSPWKSLWAFFGPALTTMPLLGPLGGVCLHSLKVLSSFPSHIHELTILFDTHLVVKADSISRSEARFLNFQVDSAFSHLESIFPFHLVCHQPGALVWLCAQNAPWAPPTYCPVFAERCPCSPELRSETQQPRA